MHKRDRTHVCWSNSQTELMFADRTLRQNSCLLIKLSDRTRVCWSNSQTELVFADSNSRTELRFADRTLRQNSCLLIRILGQNSLLFLLRSPEQTQTRVERETAWRVLIDREGESKTQQQRDLVRGSRYVSTAQMTCVKSLCVKGGVVRKIMFGCSKVGLW